MKKLFFTLIIASFAMLTFGQDCYIVTNTSPVGGCVFDVTAKFIWSDINGTHETIVAHTIEVGTSEGYCLDLSSGGTFLSVSFKACCPNFSQVNLPLNAPQTYTGGNCHGAYPADEVRWGANGSHYFKIESNK